MSSQGWRWGSLTCPVRPPILSLASCLESFRLFLGLLLILAELGFVHGDRSTGLLVRVIRGNNEPTPVISEAGDAEARPR